MDYNTNYNPKFLTSNSLFLRIMKLYYFLQWKLPVSKKYTGCPRICEGHTASYILKAKFRCLTKTLR